MSEQKFDDARAGMPWSEAQWDEFLTRAEWRAAKYKELLETLHTHPNRDALLAREMGWSHALHEIDRVDYGYGAREPNADSEQDGAEPPVFRRVRASALRMSRELLLRLEAVGESNTLARECLHEALNAVIEVPARLAAAQSFGTEDSTLGGNIAQCRRAAVATERLLDALIMAQIHGTLPNSLARTLLAQAREMRNQVELHISTLHRRIWWE